MARSRSPARSPRPKKVDDSEGGSSSRKRAKKDPQEASLSPSPMRSSQQQPTQSQPEEEHREQQQQQHRETREGEEHSPFMVDPTTAFVLLVFTIMVGNAVKDNNYKSLTDFALSPNVVFTVVVTFLVYHIGNDSEYGKTCNLTTKENFLSRWYLWNGAVFHMLMDGFGGSFNAVPLVVDQYAKLDRRFNPAHSHNSVVWTVGLIELVVMTPLCFYCYIAIKKGWASRWPMEIIVGVCHIFGMLVFCITEIKDGQRNIPAVTPIGGHNGWFEHAKWDNEHLTFYWFGFVICNLVWFVVPYLRISAAVEHILCAIKMH